MGDLVTVELHINKWAEILIEMDLLGEDDDSGPLLPTDPISMARRVGVWLRLRVRVRVDWLKVGVGPGWVRQQAGEHAKERCHATEQARRLRRCRERQNWRTHDASRHG